jgi:catechol 2,3-dioxygenase-like lactoylglutathione lyase family enzyme
MPKAIGIGGVYLQLKGPKDKLQQWYQVNLGLQMSEYGSGFIEGEQLVLLSFKHDSNGPVINFRVDDIKGLITKFKSEGLTITHEIREFEYGLFARFLDPFGNLIELWEPNVRVYKEMVIKEIENYKLKQSLIKQEK